MAVRQSTALAGLCAGLPPPWAGWRLASTKTSGSCNGRKGEEKANYETAGSTDKGAYHGAFAFLPFVP